MVNRTPLDYNYIGSICTIFENGKSSTGIFIKKWLPQLSVLKKVHDPLPDERIKIGYSQHLVDLKESRKKAIESFSSFSN